MTNIYFLLCFNSFLLGWIISQETYTEPVVKHQYSEITIPWIEFKNGLKKDM